MRNNMAATEAKTALELGHKFLLALGNPEFVKPTIYRSAIPQKQMIVPDENGNQIECDSFVAFSPEAVAAFPGSYIPPLAFQRAVENTQHLTDPRWSEMMGESMGTMEKPAYSYHSEQFGVTILHGATNNRARMLTRIAEEGFTPENRALYQHAVADMAKPAIKAENTLKGSLLIHDDCLASTISVAGYIAELKERNSPLLEKGVDIIIDGPATAQGILFMKEFAKVHNVKINIIASFLAFGLTPGEKSEKNGTRKHANYITLPDELFEKLPPHTQKKYGPGTNRQVVGDMGSASEGILPEIRKAMIAHDSTLDESFCNWNDGRTDSHHDNNSPVAVVQIDAWDAKKKKVVTYYPRGGYISYSYDKTFNPDLFKEANTQMIGASRVWSPEFGYGVAYGVKK